MVHENEANIYGHAAANCVDLVKTVDSPKLRLAYDPANFVWGEKITNNVEVCWPLMKPYVVHVHIKDWKLGAKDIGSMPGQGDGQIKELLAELAAHEIQRLRDDGAASTVGRPVRRLHRPAIVLPGDCGRAVPRQRGWPDPELN